MSEAVPVTFTTSSTCPGVMIFAANPRMIRRVLVEKCASKGVPVPTFAALESSATPSRARKRMGQRVGASVAGASTVRELLQEVASAVRFTRGASSFARCSRFRTAEGEAQPMSLGLRPRQAWTWGEGVPVESLRFAGCQPSAREYRLWRFSPTDPSHTPSVVQSWQDAALRRQS